VLLKFSRILDFLCHWAVVALVSLAGMVVLGAAENYVDSVVFAQLSALSLGLLIFLVTRRVAFSAYTAWTVMTLMTVVSMAKHFMTGSGLHVYDLVFVFGDLSVPKFLISYYPQLTIPVIVLAIAAIAVLIAIARHEEPLKTGISGRAAMLALSVAGAAVAFPTAAKSHLYYLRGSHASNFIVSLGDVASFWRPNPLLARLNLLPQPQPYPAELVCAPREEQPDIILIHGESFLPPSFVPQWSVEDAAIGNFTSDDGSTRAFGVETYGGGSWLTVMSVLSGISGADFDWMRPYLVKALTGRVKQSVPDILKACGYRTAAVMATERGFADLGPFLQSIGFDQIADSVTTSAPSLQVRDSHHLNAALSELQRNRDEGDAPLFLFVETLFPHSPYDTRLEPEAVLPGEPFNANPEINEFVRRLAMSRQDIADFYAALADAPGPRGTIAVEYGDHRPIVSQLAANPQDAPKVDLSDWSSPEYSTYYGVHSFGSARQIAQPDVPRLDAPFLGYWLIDAAGLVEGGVASDIAALVEACNGRFHACTKREELDSVLRRRIESGHLDFSGRQFGTNAGRLAAK
jgi:hypothetical protein